MAQRITLALLMCWMMARLILKVTLTMVPTCLFFLHLKIHYKVHFALRYALDLRDGLLACQQVCNFPKRGASTYRS